MLSANRASSLMLPIVLCSFSLHAQVADNSAPAVAAQVERIQLEIAEIRGLPFKSTVKAATQSTADFKERIDLEVEKDLPPLVAKHYGQIVRKLGLYRGPLIEDIRAMMQTMLASQAAAYYEPEENTFFVLLQQMPELMQGTLYSHELYHGLQHQHFDLMRYLGDPARAAGLNQDAMLARRAVVEGEATYIMTLWAVKHMTGELPDRALLAPAIAAQAQMDMEQLRAMLKQPQVSALVGEELQSSMDAADRIPPYLLQTLAGAYLRGLGFVFAVQEGGWSEVEKLYGERPPASTEQILHPEKWQADEKPVEFVWSSFEKERALRDWELLQEEVLGEFQWRIIFREYGFKAEADSASAGWNGDRFAVLKRKDSDAMLLLMRTSWDTQQDAAEFATTYRRLLAMKYETPEPVRVVQQGTEVTIVEGAKEANMEALLRFASKAARKVPQRSAQ